MFMHARTSGLNLLTINRTLDKCLEAPNSGGSIALALPLTLTIRPGTATTSAGDSAEPDTQAMLTETSGITFAKVGDDSRFLTASATSDIASELTDLLSPYSLMQTSQPAKEGYWLL